MASGGESKVVAVIPSLSGVVPPGSVTGTVVAAATLLAAISMVMAESMSEVSLVAPPPPPAAKEERETRLPSSLGGGPHASPS